jgi:hypothetical protein
MVSLRHKSQIVLVALPPPGRPAKQVAELVAIRDDLAPF